MPKITKIGFRGWLATWLQDRRRSRQNILPPPVPNAPVMAYGGFEWDITAAGWADVWVGWTFDHGAHPVATIEIWRSENGGGFSHIVTVSSLATENVWIQATGIEVTYDFRARYVNGDTYGPFSPFTIQVNVQI